MKVGQGFRVGILIVFDCTEFGKTTCTCNDVVFTGQTGPGFLGEVWFGLGTGLGWIEVGLQTVDPCHDLGSMRMGIGEGGGLLWAHACIRTRG